MIRSAVPYPGFIGASHRAKSLRASQERTINLYPQFQATDQGKNAVILLSTPGVTSWATLPTSPFRGGHLVDGRLFVAAGAVLYEVHSNQTYTAIGAIAYTDGLPVTFADNGVAGGQLLIAASGNGYVVNLSTNALTLERTGNTRMVEFLEGYFIALDAANSKFEWSELFDGTSWPGTNFFIRSNRSDPWCSMRVLNERLVLFGDKTSDTYWAGGTYPNVFQPLEGGTMEEGIAAADSVVELGGSAIWLAQNGNGVGGVVMTPGASPREISHHALRTAIEGYARIDDAVGSVYESEGHQFYLLTFPSARVTWVYDLKVPGAWCERGTWISEENDYDYWRPTFHQYAFGLHLVGDRTSGVIYRMADNLYSDVDDRVIRRARRAPALSQGGRDVYYGYFGLEAEAGVAPPGVDPLVELRISDNGGNTFSGAKSIRAQGELTARAEWYGLGKSDDRVFEVVMASRAPYRLTNAFLSVRNAA
jgi:hypothetical protein